MATRAPFITYDSTLLDHVGVGATSAAARRSIRIAAMLFLTVLTAASAQFSVHLPFTPVPSTLQPMVVLIGAAALGARLGACSQALYLLLGIVGVPVFAASGLLPQGAARLIGPTGGYLLMYPVAAFVTGALAERGFDRRYASSLVAVAAGLAVLFAGGVLWLAFFAFGPGARVGLETALQTGLYPFLVQDLIEIAVASAVLPAAWRLLPGAKE